MRKAEMVQSIFLIVFSTSAALLVFARMYNILSHGIDFSDEGLYINSIVNPYLYSTSITQFGFLYHPLFVGLGENLILLRQINVIGTAVIAGLLCFAVCQRDGNRPTEAFAFASLASVTALLPLQTWLPTPSYNSLCLQAMLVAAFGLVLSASERRAVRHCGWVMLGCGGYLAGMAKPTSAIALALAALCYFAFERRLTLHGLLTAVLTAVGLTALTAILIDGSISTFHSRITRGLDASALLQSGHSLADILSLSPPRVSRNEGLLFISAFIMAAAACLLLQSAARWVRVVGYTVCVTLVTLALFNFLVLDRPLIAPSTLLSLMTVAAVLGALVSSLDVAWRDFRSLIRKPLGSEFMLVLLPFCYSIGTRTNFWATAAAAGVFWVIGGLKFAGRFDLRTAYAIRLALGATTFCATLVVLAASSNSPYRQTQPLLSQWVAVNVGTADTRVFLSLDFAKYLGTLDDLATNAGFSLGTPVIDLTGHYPSALFSLGAKAIGQAWLIGGYKGSEDLAAAMLRLASCEHIAAAWVLAEPNGPRSLSRHVIGEVGEYDEVGRLASPTGTYPDSYEQVLLKPAGDIEARREKCESFRRIAP